MSRKKRPSSIGTRSPMEAGEKLISSLKTLEGLCKLYDEGNFEIAAEMCVTTERICKDELRLSRF